MTVNFWTNFLQNKIPKVLPCFMPYLCNFLTHISSYIDEFTPNEKIICLYKKLISIFINSIDDSELLNICCREQSFIWDYPVLGRILTIGRHIWLLWQLNAKPNVQLTNIPKKTDFNNWIDPCVKLIHISKKLISTSECTTNGQIIRLHKHLVPMISNKIDYNGIFNTCCPELNTF